MNRMTFLSHFTICLAIAAAAWFANEQGVFAVIYSNDQSMMTSVIAALFVVTAFRLARQAWIVDNLLRQRHTGLLDTTAPIRRLVVDPTYGHLAERLAVMAGFVGTAIGLSLQAKALAGGSTSFTALATSLFTTACGGTAAALIAILTYNLEIGIRRLEW
jgi:hypothetical protein